MNENRKKLLGALIGLARATEGNEHLITPTVTDTVIRSLAAEAPEEISLCLSRVEEEKRKMVPDCFYCASPCGRTDSYDLNRLGSAPTEPREMKEQLLADLCRLAPAFRNKDNWIIYKILIAVGIEEFTAEELLPIAQELLTLEY